MTRRPALDRLGFLAPVVTIAIVVVFGIAAGAIGVGGAFFTMPWSLVAGVLLFVRPPAVTPAPPPAPAAAV
jgi:hypothetical protein